MARSPNSSPQTRELLAVMLQYPRRWQYGYELSKQSGLKSGTLYPLLIRLSDQGLLEARWQEPERPGKPPRHAYKLTPEGAAFARQVAAPGKSPVARRKLLGATT
jgi:PadR family transcriptional regulator PadR